MFLKRRQLEQKHRGVGARDVEGTGGALLRLVRPDTDCLLSWELGEDLPCWGGGLLE